MRQPATKDDYAASGADAGLIARAKASVKKIIIPAAVISFFVNILMLTGPLYMLQIYDRVLSSRSYETLFVITLLTLGLFAAMALLDFARSALLARAGEDFERNLSEATFDMAMEASHSGATSAERPLHDLRRLRQFVASPALTAVFDAPWAPFFLAIVFAMHWLLGLVALAGLVGLVSLSVANERASSKVTVTAQEATVEADRLASAALRNSGAADAMGMRRALRERWLTLGRTANDHALAAGDTAGGLTAASKAGRLFLQSAILGAGAYLAINGAITPGVMIAASIIAGRALAPIEIMTSQWKSFILAANAYRNLSKFIDAAQDTERMSLPRPNGALNVSRVFCQPAGAKRPVLKGVTFAIEAGEALGIIGPSAAGKTTLARALVGVERAASGEIRLDGAAIDNWNKEELGQYLGYLPQEVELFAGTVAENISRFSADVAPADIIAAAEAAGAHQMILGLADGYDTQIGDRGRNLSAGQRQRVGLARALFGGPSMIVLDEPNSNLDPDGEAALSNAVQRLKSSGVTTIIVAHRPSTVAFVDKLLLLADGEVKAFGPRDEILQKIAPGRVAPFTPAQSRA